MSASAMEPTTVHVLTAFEAYASANTAGYLARSAAGQTTADDGAILMADVPAPLAIGVQKADDMSPLEPLTVFHSRSTIPMTLVDLAKVMQRATKSTEEVTLVAVVLMCRYAARTLAVTRHMMHRLYVAALQIALKTHNDEFYTNACYAKAAGVSLQEMNRLELHLMLGLNWSSAVLLNPSCRLTESAGSRREALLNLAAVSLDAAPEIRAPTEAAACTTERMVDVQLDSPIVAGASIVSDPSSPAYIAAGAATMYSCSYMLPSPATHSASASRIMP